MKPPPPLPDRLPASLRGVKALTFDVFGTLVNWELSVERECKQADRDAASRKAGTGPKEADAVDWLAFTREWRAEYYRATAEVAKGLRPFKTIDETHRDILDSLVLKHRLAGLWTEAELVRLNLAWHRLDAWKDVPEGLRVLRKSVYCATLSNGNVSLLVDLARHGGMAFDAVLSGELYQSYKPDPKVYLGAAKMLGVQPEEVAMVAAHRWDLHAARACGLRTVYLLRPTEDGAKGYDADAEKMGFDLVVGSLEDAGALFEREAERHGKARM
ncbi:haloacid dehalogenase [Hyaloraphidium curvatum]|nr:haloacid dehalogenase [Hyaloraphidium curvatum]